MRRIENLLCWQCGRSLDDCPQPIGRRDQCPGCGADLHVCRFCVSYAPRRALACEQPLEETPGDKTRSNYCDWFEPRPDAFQGGGDARAEQSRRDLEALFGLSAGSDQAGAGSDAEAARKGLADLFGEDPDAKS